MHSTENKLGNWMTASEMAMQTYRYDNDGNVWRGRYKWGWSDISQVYACLGEQDELPKEVKDVPSFCLSAREIVANAYAN